MAQNCNIKLGGNVMKNIRDLYSKTYNTLLNRPKFLNHAHGSDDRQYYR